MKVSIHSGACGYTTIVQAETDTNYQSTLQIESQCPHVKKMAESLGRLDVMNELFKKGQSQILLAGNQHLPHITCPVAIGMLKVLEASAGMALPKDVAITYSE